MPQLRQPPGQTWIAPAGARRFDLRAETVPFVEDDFRAEVLFVEGLAQIGNDHDGKLQPLALVNAHEPHGVLRRGGRDLRFGLGFLLGFDEAQKAEKALPLELVEMLYQAQEFLHVRVALFAPLPGAQPIRVMRLRQHRFQAARKRRLPRQLSPATKSGEKLIHFPLQYLLTPDT